MEFQVNLDEVDINLEKIFNDEAAAAEQTAAENNGQSNHTEHFFGKDSNHGFAKRVILHKTLQGWFRYYYCEGFKRTCYIDGFSGAGQYGYGYTTVNDTDEGDKPKHHVRTTNTNVICKYGSPLIALHNVQDTFMTLDRALRKQEFWKEVTTDELVRAGRNNMEWIDLLGGANMARYRPPFKADLVMVEPDEERLTQLRNTMQQRDPIDDLYDHSIMRYWPHYVHDTFQEASEMIEDRFLQKKYMHPLRGLVSIPTFAFLDPFGYSQIPMSIVKNYLGEQRTVLINVMIGFMNRFKKLENHKPIINELYGCMDWQDISEGLEPAERYKRYAKLYERQLKQNGATYTLSFAMRDARNILKYYMIFGTNDFRILKTAKEALNKVTQERNCFKFSAYYIKTNQRELEWKNEQDPNDEAAVIWKDFEGEDFVSVEDIECYVYKSDTPYVHRKKSLKLLYKEGKLSYVEGCQPPRKGTFPHNQGVFVRFASCEEEAVKVAYLRCPKTPNEEAMGIFHKFQGQSGISVSSIKPKWKRSLKILFDTHRLFYDPETKPKRRGSFPDHVQVSFARDTEIIDFEDSDISTQTTNLSAPDNTVCNDYNYHAAEIKPPLPKLEMDPFQYKREFRLALNFQGCLRTPPLPKLQMDPVNSQKEMKLALRFQGYPSPTQNSDNQSNVMSKPASNTLVNDAIIVLDSDEEHQLRELKKDEIRSERVPLSFLSSGFP